MPTCSTFRKAPKRARPDPLGSEDPIMRNLDAAFLPVFEGDLMSYGTVRAALFCALTPASGP